MTTIITQELLQSWSPCRDGYERFCELFPKGADLATAINGLVSDGHDDWAYWLFCKCRENGIHNELTDKGYRNSGYRNSGNLNSGDWNSGYRNSGNLNSGDLNSGNLNSGDWNSGDWNSGDWNSGDWNSGYFNIDRPSVIRVFGKDCPIDVWDRAYKPSFLWFDLTYWVPVTDMTDDEKRADPHSHVRGGQLRTRDYKEAFKLSWNNADKQDRAKIKDLPNFNRQMFLEISGIDVDGE